MLTWFKRVMFSPSPSSSKTHASLRVPISVLDENIPRYPPFMKGLPVIDPDKLLATQQELIAQIAASVLTSGSMYEKHYLGAMRRFAAYAHLLPASQSHHHRGAGGLLRHSIEVGLWALQASDKMLLELGRTPLQRRELEPRWQLTAFLAGLCHDAGKPATDLVVSTHDRTLLWKPIKENLWEWSRSNGVDAYFLDWRPGRSKQHIALSNLIADRIITTETLTWIEEGGTELIVWLMEALNGNPGTVNPLYDLVLKADQTSVERDLKSMGVAMAGYDLGVPVERHLTDIMRRLIKQGIWSINEPGARVWNVGGNIYLVWPAAGDEIARQVKDDGVPGIPRTGDGILDMLVERHLAFVKPDSDGTSRFWKIAPAVLSAKIPDIALSCIRLRDDALVSSTPIAAVEGVILGDGSSSVPDSTKVSQNTAPVEPSEDNGSRQSGKADAKNRSRPVSVTDTPPASATALASAPAPALKIDSETGEILTPLDCAGAPISEKTSAPKAETAASLPDRVPGVVAAPPRKINRSGPPQLALDGACGEALKALAEDIKSGAKQWGFEARMEPDERVLLLWPGAFAGYGLTGRVILEELSEKGWLWVDQMAPLKKVQEFDENGTTYKAIRLEPEPSEAFAYAAGYAGQQDAVSKNVPMARPAQVAQSSASTPGATGQEGQARPEPPRAARDGHPMPEVTAAPSAAASHQSEQHRSNQDKSEKPKRPKKPKHERSMPRIAPAGERTELTLAGETPAGMRSAEEKGKEEQGRERVSSAEAKPKREPSITASVLLKDVEAAQALSNAPKLEQVLATLTGKGAATDEPGWERILLQQAKATFKEAGLEVSRAHLHNLCKSHSDQLCLVKGMVLYRVKSMSRQS